MPPSGPRSVTPNDSPSARSAAAHRDAAERMQLGVDVSADVGRAHLGVDVGRGDVVVDRAQPALRLIDEVAAQRAVRPRSRPASTAGAGAC